MPYLINDYHINTLIIVNEYFPQFLANKWPGTDFVMFRWISIILENPFLNMCPNLHELWINSIISNDHSRMSNILQSKDMYSQILKVFGPYTGPCWHKHRYRHSFTETTFVCQITMSNHTRLMAMTESRIISTEPG